MRTKGTETAGEEQRGTATAAVTTVIYARTGATKYVQPSKNVL